MAEQGTESVILRNPMRHADSRMTDCYTDGAVVDISSFLAPREVKIDGK